jgi:hypothetical protein
MRTFYISNFIYYGFHSIIYTVNFILYPESFICWLDKNMWKLQFWLGMIIFGSVRFLSKKKTKSKFKKKTETGSNWLGSNFSVWLGFFSLAQFFSVRFGFFSFSLIKPKPNRTGRFFQNFNRLFSRFGFFIICFLFVRSPLNLIFNMCYDFVITQSSIIKWFWWLNME